MKRVILIVVVLLAVLYSVPAKADSFVQILKQPNDGGFDPICITKFTADVNNGWFVQVVCCGRFDEVALLSEGTIGFSIGCTIPFSQGNVRPTLRIDTVEGDSTYCRLEFDGCYGDVTWLGTGLRYDLTSGSLQFSSNSYVPVSTFGDLVVGLDADISWTEGNSLNFLLGPYIEYPLFGGKLHGTVNEDFVKIWWFSLL